VDCILAVDDDVGLTELLSEYLRDEQLQLDAVHDGETAVEKILQGSYALIILDIMLPRLGGFEVLRKIREHSQIPVIMLTARAALTDKVMGLETGADDYLPKPFQPPELVARVRSILRRTQNHPVARPEILVVADIELDAGRRLLRRGDELADLATAFNEMASRIEQLINAQKRLIADISHEFRSPLTRVNLALGLAVKKAEGSVAPLLSRIGLETERLGELIHQLLLLAQLDNEENPGPLADVDLSELVGEVVADTNFEAATQGKQVVLKFSDECSIFGSAFLIRSALENVIRNAIRYTAEATAIEVILRVEYDESTITIRDHGPGVPEDELTQIFEPFYRVSEARDSHSGGAGLGLAIAHRAVELHGGRISAFNRGTGGLEVKISLKSSAPRPR
jgi:signal transduction histidine kinase